MARGIARPVYDSADRVCGKIGFRQERNLAVELNERRDIIAGVRRAQDHDCPRAQPGTDDLDDEIEPVLTAKIEIDQRHIRPQIRDESACLRSVLGRTDNHDTLMFEHPTDGIGEAIVVINDHAPDPLCHHPAFASSIQ